jgi:hypothetical protein
MTFDNLKEMNGSPSMQVGVEFIFAECDIKIPDTMSAKVDSVSIEENEQMLYKFLSELRFNMKIDLNRQKILLFRRNRDPPRGFQDQLLRK